ncbi:hypothetical protein E2C01_050564 [Portunus trituberculatus]|uniref:Uncharacterized protein n=1 Tax=Portunus trituberculatus TaxID=210409 RepID=A0A5B7G8M7_PORTR|nr:hypothetical protein [Portunus trituberculatus]
MGSKRNRTAQASSNALGIQTLVFTSRALLISPRKRFRNRFQGSGIRYSPAALYRFHEESVLEPVPTVPPAVGTDSLNT